MTNDGKGFMLQCTRVICDKNQDTVVKRKQRHIKEFGKYKKIGTLFRLNASRLGSGDFLLSRKHSETIKRLSEILFGKSGKDIKRILNKICDIDHLVGHLFNKRDIFITRDKNFLKKTKKQLLKKEFNVLVETPEEFLNRFKR